MFSNLKRSYWRSQRACVFKISTSTTNTNRKEKAKQILTDQNHNLKHKVQFQESVGMSSTFLNIREQTNGLLSDCTNSTKGSTTWELNILIRTIVVPCVLPCLRAKSDASERRSEEANYRQNLLTFCDRNPCRINNTHPHSFGMLLIVDNGKKKKVCAFDDFYSCLSLASCLLMCWRRDGRRERGQKGRNNVTPHLLFLSIRYAVVVAKYYSIRYAFMDTK